MKIYIVFFFVKNALSATSLIVKKGGHYPDRVDTSQLVTAWVNKESAINHRSFWFHTARKIGTVNCDYPGYENRCFSLRYAGRASIIFDCSQKSIGE